MPWGGVGLMGPSPHTSPLLPLPLGTGAPATPSPRTRTRATPTACPSLPPCPPEACAWAIVVGAEGGLGRGGCSATPWAVPLRNPGGLEVTRFPAGGMDRGSTRGGTHWPRMALSNCSRVGWGGSLAGGLSEGSLVGGGGAAAVVAAVAVAAVAAAAADEGIMWGGSWAMSRSGRWRLLDASVVREGPLAAADTIGAPLLPCVAACRGAMVGSMGPLSSQAEGTASTTACAAHCGRCVIRSMAS